MSIKATTRQVNGVTVVDVSGPITLGEGSSTLRETVYGLLDSGQKKILLNLGDVTYIDSSGIGELVNGFTTVTGQGGQLKLLNLTKNVQDLLRITKLNTVFDVHDDETAGFAAFPKRLVSQMMPDTPLLPNFTQCGAQYRGFSAGRHTHSRTTVMGVGSGNRTRGGGPAQGRSLFGKSRLTRPTGPTSIITRRCQASYSTQGGDPARLRVVLRC